MRVTMIINKEKKQLYILLACGVLALAVSIWAFRMEKSTGMMVSAEIEDRSRRTVHWIPGHLQVP